jgi:hypothetical protein
MYTNVFAPYLVFLLPLMMFGRIVFLGHEIGCKWPIRKRVWVYTLVTSALVLHGVLFVLLPWEQYHSWLSIGSVYSMGMLLPVYSVSLKDSYGRALWVPVWRDAFFVEITAVISSTFLPLALGL